MYCYIADMCPDKNQWCEDDDGHIDISECASSPVPALLLRCRCPAGYLLVL